MRLKGRKRLLIVALLLLCFPLGALGQLTYTRGWDFLQIFLPLWLLSSLKVIYIKHKFDTSEYVELGSSKAVSFAYLVYCFLLSIFFTSIWMEIPYPFLAGSLFTLLLLHSTKEEYLVAASYLHLAVFLQLCLLSQAKIRSNVHRMLISLPASFFFSSTVFSMFFLPLIALSNGISSIIVAAIPVCLAFSGLLLSIDTKKTHTEWETIRIDFTQGREVTNGLKRINLNNKNTPSPSSASSSSSKGRALRVVQITDPHIGSMMPPWRVQKMCNHILQLDPDLVLLTGDFFTLEAHGPPKDALRKALEPLKEISHKTFACLGNHDLESHALPLVQNDLKVLGIKLLVDDEFIFETSDGVKIQIIGLNYSGTYAHTAVPLICKKFPPREGMLRFIMLHDPTGFQYLPLHENAFVFSGHTHGGQLGLLSFGLPFTLVGLFTGQPDWGLWGNGKNRLYVNRGQGSRSIFGSMIVRMGVPPEQSLLSIRV